MWVSWTQFQILFIPPQNIFMRHKQNVQLFPFALLLIFHAWLFLNIVNFEMMHTAKSS